MKPRVCLAAALLLALPLFAQNERVTATATTQTKTTIKDPNGKTLGEAVTQTKQN